MKKEAAKYPIRTWSAYSTAAKSSALLLVFGFFPHTVFAQVVISEFLYDAEGSDTDKEWVELFNAGSSAIDLSKWKINDGSNHVLNVPPKNDGRGSITIEPGGYSILAADAATFIGQYTDVANVIDTALALPNTSGTISLIGEDGTTVDTFAYTKDMGGAGDGNTLHRASVSGTTFAPASPSPGGGSLTAQSNSDNTNTDDQTNDTNTGTTTATTTESQTAGTNTRTPVSSYVPPPLPQLFADGGPDRTVIVGADVEFHARAYGRTQDIVDKVRFMWNFGDGITLEGETVSHHFEYPGRYAVLLTIAHDRDAAGDRIIVTAEPARLAFSVLADGGIAIENKSGHDLDLSHWIVRNFGRDFMLPERTIVLPGATFHASQKTLGFPGGLQTELRYPNGVLALHAGEESGASTPRIPTAPSVSAAPLQSLAVFAPVPNLKHIAARAAVEEETNVEETAAEEPDSVQSTSGLVAQGVTAVGSASPSSLWWIVVVGFAMLASLVLITAHYLQRNEWEITEEVE